MANGIAVAIVVLVLVAAGAYVLVLHPITQYGNSTTTQFPSQPTTTFHPVSGGGAITSSTNTTTVQTTTFEQSNQSNQSLYYYALSLINQDRQQYGLSNVTLSSESSGQQHAQSMLDNNYFSHWDIWGLKPYMRYTLLGGTGAVSENIAYQSSSQCVLSICSGTLEPKAALEKMEYSMMYNDSACCNNGHRDNILNPYHTQVSIGIAYNLSTIYFVEDFIDSYINWNGGTPSYSGPSGSVHLLGTLLSGATLSYIQVAYDPLVAGMSRTQLDNTKEYGYGKIVAGVVQSPRYYYQGIDTIVADSYSSQDGGIDISFGLKNLTSQYGAGEYTVMTWLNDSSGKSFVGASYTLFLSTNGAQIPQGSV
ncbi:MAG: CAP domain-containing protein [Candidatus Micrarchaeota archaeon]|nr:CAP domain-containing protein [Candidatus Micrarchaeota archaeon]MDE1847341.1 CAP domain-containing protein [Candidatus Micrarchaeota archaeon]MDE1863956.1 CAP domain-containing protein [Candidatus Micrarchaeota archaeon]